MVKDLYTKEDADVEDGGSRPPLGSHVQGDSDRVYGEPKGPTGNALFDKTAPSERPSDRNRHGFVGGTTRRTKGDEVGSGPEGYEHLPKPDEVDDPATND